LILKTLLYQTESMNLLFTEMKRTSQNYVWTI